MGFTDKPELARHLLVLVCSHGTSGFPLSHVHCPPLPSPLLPDIQALFCGKGEPSSYPLLGKEG